MNFYLGSLNTFVKRIQISQCDCNTSTVNIIFHKLTEIQNLFIRYCDNKETGKINSLCSSNEEKSEKYNVFFRNEKILFLSFYL